MQLPSKPSRKLRIARGPVSLSPPLVKNESVFVGYEEGDILRLDGSQLQSVWQIPAEGFGPWSSVGELVLLRSMGSPGFRGVSPTGRIMWTLSGDPGWALCDQHLYSNDGETIIQADATTGEIVAHYAVPGPAFQFLGCCHGIFLLGTGRTRESDPVRAFDVTSGQILWERNLRQEFLAAAEGIEERRTAFYSAHCGSEGRRVVHCAQSLFGFAVRENRILWQRNFDLASVVPKMHEGRVYFWAYSGRERAEGNNVLVCLDEATGETIYELPLATYGGDFAWMQFPRGSVHVDHMAFGTRSGLLAVFRLSDGALVWSCKYKTEVYQPVLWDHGLLVTAEDGNLLVFEAKPATPERPQTLDVRGAEKQSPEFDYRVDVSVLQEEHGERLAAVVLDPLWEALPDDKWLDAKELLQRATPGQRMLMSIYQFINWTMYTEGFESFFRSGSAPLANSLPGAFETMGLPGYAYECRKLLALFLNERVPEDPEACSRALDAVPEAERQRVFDEVGEALSRLMDEEHFEGSCSEYVLAHPADFVRGNPEGTRSS
jgi:outer membrane protein assembly factor BamB